MRKFKFKLNKTYPVISPLVKWITNIPFVLTLKILNLRYGSGNVPQEVLNKYIGPYMSVNDNEHVMILLCATVNKFYSHFRLDKHASTFCTNLGAFVRGEDVSTDFIKLLENIINAPMLRQRLAQTLLDSGELTIVKYQWFTKAEVDTWLNEKDEITVWLETRK